jgi:tetratricopeptide (TPR) repeat protein
VFGTFDIIPPRGGYALVTNFSLSALYCEDDDLPLSYVFSYASQDGRFITLMEKSEFLSLSTLLPSGNETNNYNLTLRSTALDSLNADTSVEKFVQVVPFITTAKEEVISAVFNGLDDYRSLRYYSAYISQIGQSGLMISSSSHPSLDALDNKMDTLANISSTLLTDLTSQLQYVDYSDDNNQLSNVISMCSIFAGGDVIQSGNYADVVDDAVIFASRVVDIYVQYGFDDILLGNDLLACLNSLELIRYQLFQEASVPGVSRRLQSGSTTYGMVSTVFSKIRSGVLIGESVTELYSSFSYFVTKSWTFQLLEAQTNTLIFSGPAGNGTANANSVDYESVRKSVDLAEGTAYSFDVLSFQNMTSKAICRLNSTSCDLISSPAAMQYSFNITTGESVPMGSYELITAIRTAIDPTSLITSFDEFNLEYFELVCPILSANESIILEKVCSGGGAEGPESTYSYVCDDSTIGSYLTGSCPLYNRQVLFADYMAVEYSDYTLLEYDNTFTKFGYNVSVDTSLSTGDDVTYAFSGSSSTLVGLFLTIEGQTQVAYTPTISPTIGAQNLDAGTSLVNNTSVFSIVIPLILLCVCCIFCCLFIRRRRKRDTLKYMDKYAAGDNDCMEDLFGVYIEFAQALRAENRFEEAEEMYSNAVGLIEGTHVPNAEESVDGAVREHTPPPPIDIRVIDKASTYNALADLMTARGDHLEALPLYCKAHNLLKKKILKVGDVDFESDDEEDVISFEQFTAGCVSTKGHVLDGQLVEDESGSDDFFAESEEEVDDSESHFFDINFSNTSNRRTVPIKETSTLFWPACQSGQSHSSDYEHSSEDDLNSIDDSEMGSDSDDYRMFVDGDLDVVEDNADDNDSDDEDDGFLRINLVNIQSREDRNAQSSAPTAGAGNFEGGHEDGINRTFSSML